MLAAKFFISSVYQHDEDHEAPWLQNPTMYKHAASWIERWIKAYDSGSQYACEIFFALSYISCDGP